jgi:acetyl esterase/lipase
MRVERDLVYRTIDGIDLHGDVRCPDVGDVFPAVVLAIGGGFKKAYEDKMAEIGRVLAGPAQGFLTFAVDYRVGLGAEPATYDVAEAVEFLARGPIPLSDGTTVAADPDRIGILGSSAGAIVACILALRLTRLRAAVAYSGHAGDPPVAATREPAPLFAAHSTIDSSAPYAYATKLRDLYDYAGAPHDLYVTTEKVHGLQFWSYLDAELDDPEAPLTYIARELAVAHLTTYVKNAPPA